MICRRTLLAALGVATNGANAELGLRSVGAQRRFRPPAMAVPMGTVPVSARRRKGDGEYEAVRKALTSRCLSPTLDAKAGLFSGALFNGMNAGSKVNLFSSCGERLFLSCGGTAIIGSPQSMEGFHAKASFCACDARRNWGGVLARVGRVGNPSHTAAQLLPD